MRSGPATTQTWDLFSESFARDPHPRLAWLRRHEPVHFDEGTGLWLVTRHRDVRRILLDPDRFRPDNALEAVTPLSVASLRILARAKVAFPPALADNGGPDHPALRRLVAGFFNAERVRAAVPVIEDIATDLLHGLKSGMRDGRNCDLVKDFARLLPCRVLTHLLGMEQVDVPTLTQWSDDALDLFWGRPAPDRQVELARSVAAFHSWICERMSPASADAGLMEALRGLVLSDGTPLDRATAVAACFFILVAGQSTTGQLIATVLRRALGERDAWARAALGSGFAEAWVDETLRLEPSVTTWRRITACEVELAGVRIPAGSPLLLMLMSAGADPEVFEQPDQRCPYRENVRHHLAFGAGRHRCPGALLARTEAAVALRTAARMMPDAVAVGDGTHLPMLSLLSFRAPTSLLATRHH